jgi:hypothetical protein
MSNIIKFFIAGMTGFIVCKNINDIFFKPIKKSTKKPITKEIATQTNLTGKEIDEALICKKEFDSINNGTYEWKIV